jgi:hypothetical protein
MLIALAVVLAAIVVFWLTGDKNKKPEKQRGSVEQVDRKQKAARRDAPADAKRKADAKQGDEKKPIPGWKRAMVRPRDSDPDEDGERAREPEQKRPVSPHAPGPPTR